MGAELPTEGRKAGWAQCKERMLTLIKEKLLELDPALIDPNLAMTEGAKHVTPKEAERVTPDKALCIAPERVIFEEAERITPSEG